MDYANFSTTTTGGDIQSIILNNGVDPNLLTNSAAPVVTESMDLESILAATYEAEVAKHQALWEQAQAEAAAQLAQVAAIQAAQIQAFAEYNQQMMDALNQQTLASIEMQPISQDLNAAAALNTTATTGGFGEGALTAGGFIMPTASEKETIYKIVAAEGGNIAPEEATNILSTMINRAKTGNWGGNNLLTIATRPQQYVVYETGAYKSAALNPISRAACDNLLASTSVGGPTSHVYQSFRSAGSTSYSNNQLVPGGNRYGVPMV